MQRSEREREREGKGKTALVIVLIRFGLFFSADASLGERTLTFYLRLVVDRRATCCFCGEPLKERRKTREHRDGSRRREIANLALFCGEEEEEEGGEDEKEKNGCERERREKTERHKHEPPEKKREKREI